MLIMVSRRRKRPKRLRPRIEHIQIGGICPDCGRPDCGIEDIVFAGSFAGVGREIGDRGGTVRVSFVSPDYPGSDDPVFRAIFLGEGEEDLTDEVIEELVRDGWPELELRSLVAQGGRYNRIRNSVVFPPESIDDL